MTRPAHLLTQPWLGALHCFLLTLVLLSPRARAAPARTEVLHLATCPGHSAAEAGEFWATLTGELILARAFVSQDHEDEEIRQSIQQQVRYLWGHYRTDPAAHRALQLVLSGEEPQIAIRRKTSGVYGRDLTLDWKPTGQHLEITDPYTTRAVRSGAVRRDDPALLIDYQVRFKIALCGRAEAPPAELHVPLPRDPWLFYWHVPAAARRPMEYAGVLSVTNPCSDDDFAELPHPYYYWYDWQPGRHGPDAKGRPFDCRTLLRPGTDFVQHTVPLRALGRPTGTFPLLRRALLDSPGPITATVLIGALDHEWKDLALDALAAEIGAGQDLAGRAQEVLSRPVLRERGTQKFLRLLRDLKEVLAVQSFQSAPEDGYARVEVSGALRRSGKPVRVRALVGLTDVFGPTPPGHWAILRRALTQDHLVIYAGHSGIGENFRLAQIEQHLALPHADFIQGYRRAPFQLIAFLSCYSYMYFGQDLLDAGTERLVPRGEFVFTGTEYTKGDRGALSLLDLVDQVLSDKGARVSALRYLDPEDFWLLKEAGRDAGPLSEPAAR